MAHICEWLTEKVDSYSSRLHPEPKDIAEEVRTTVKLPINVIVGVSYREDADHLWRS